MCAYQRRSSPGLDPTALRGLLRSNDQNLWMALGGVT